MVPPTALAGIRSDLEAQFAVTVFEECEAVRIIGSPVEIKGVNTYLARHGVSVP
ncbi:hypothetical protein C497_14162 [Halalkalicoccus jeotgali B3]|uniref:Uncharacterized protein n=1 Tax=Halalkalicoccus jeotgali (strain DSM 18796 / CECT 7217 / JCM 14584 / KCTC 4019 / B3) TaxID=795797 RepID=L9VCG7_HALJB|nr:hypothetical protein C497_14162 [Halalkalicoccus jeotgali B3]